MTKYHSKRDETLGRITSFESLTRGDAFLFINEGNVGTMVFIKTGRWHARAAIIPGHSRAPCPSQPVLPICEVTLTYKIGDPK